MKEKYALLAGGLTKALQLPDDFSRENVMISMHGQEHVWIENFRGISSYTEEEIRLVTKKRTVCIFGRRLKIVSYAKDEIEITGCIQKLEYQ